MGVRGLLVIILGGPIGAVVGNSGPSGPRQSDGEGLIALDTIHESSGVHLGHIFGSRHSINSGKAKVFFKGNCIF